MYRYLPKIKSCFSGLRGSPLGSDNLYIFYEHFEPRLYDEWIASKSIKRGLHFITNQVCMQVIMHIKV